MINSLKKPITFLFRFVFFLAFIIIARLFYLQIHSSLVLLKKSERNYLRISKIISPRGNIVDCNNQLIATNRPIIQLIWQGSGNHQFTQEQHASLSLLDTFFKQAISTNSEILIAEQSGKRIVLVDDICFDQLSYLVEQFPHHKNLLIHTAFQRYYPYITTACHILGYLSRISCDGSGTMGLENIFDDALKGVPGQLAMTINSLGRSLQSKEVQQALTGRTLHTTLDIHLQQFAEQAFPQDSRGALIIMEAKTGALLSVISRPHFDPNIFLKPIDPAQWQELQQNQPFINRAFSACYPPASLFKLVTLTAALEENLIDPQSMWLCTGHTTFKGRSHSCNKKTGHGLLTLQDALAHSCNIPFYEIGRRIKIDTLAHYATMLGLGSKSTTYLPEKSGLVPTSKWKRQVKGESWWPGETLSASIGQSFLLVTPLQICRMIGGLVEGFLVTPRILADDPIQQEPVTIRKNTRSFILQSMQYVVSRGSGQVKGKLQDIVIYAKTGGAQVKNYIKTGPVTDQPKEHGWFAAHITYKSHPSIIIVVLSENVGSSSFSKLITKKFLVDYCNYMDNGPLKATANIPDDAT